MKYFSVFLIWCVSLTKSAPTSTSCSIDPFVSGGPIFIRSKTTNLIYPEHGQKVLKFTTNKKFELACPNGEVTVKGISAGTIVTASCVQDSTFGINGAAVSWDQISCTREITPTVTVLAHESTDDGPHNRCFDAKNTLKLVQIGFQLDADRFLNFIDICFDSVRKVAVYSYFVVPSSINSRVSKITKPSFKQDNNVYNFPHSINELYKNGQSTINGILGLPSTSTEYVNNGTFLNRGHLAARTDFVYEPFQKGTYRYVNVAPQWNTFNGGNWEGIEKSVRNYADANQLDLQIWTGVYGNAVLPNTRNSNQEKLYLYVVESDTKNSPSFPVVQIYWRLVYSPVNKKAIIIVGHNNPYDNDVHILCSTDLSSRVDWLKWNRKDIKKGFSYACDYNDEKFRGLVPEIPKLDVVGLLI